MYFTFQRMAGRRSQISRMRQHLVAEVCPNRQLVADIHVALVANAERQFSILVFINGNHFRNACQLDGCKSFGNTL